MIRHFMIKRVFVLLAFCHVICVDAQNKEIDSIRRVNRGKNISWVNPQLPDGTGLEHKILKSNSLGHDVGYVVWLPEEYHNQTQKKFPVIYFLHGVGGDESKDSGGFSTWLQKAMDTGDFPEAICVFPNGGRSGYRNEVEAMIIDELLPTIDSKYRTIGTPASRALLGFSMGGYGSVNLSLAHPDLFCAAGSMGGNIRELEKIRDKVDMAIPVWKASNFGFFMVNGDQDRPEAFQEFSSILKENGIKVERMILEDTKHNLGHYYERSAMEMLKFIGRHLMH